MCAVGVVAMPIIAAVQLGRGEKADACEWMKAWVFLCVRSGGYPWIRHDYDFLSSFDSYGSYPDGSYRFQYRDPRLYSCQRAPAPDRG